MSENGSTDVVGSSSTHQEQSSQEIEGSTTMVSFEGYAFPTNKGRGRYPLPPGLGTPVVAIVRSPNLSSYSSPPRRYRPPPSPDHRPGDENASGFTHIFDQGRKERRDAKETQRVSGWLPSKFLEWGRSRMHFNYATVTTNGPEPSDVAAASTPPAAPTPNSNTISYLALDIIQKHPEMAFARDDENRETALHVMARKHSAYYSGRQPGFVQRCISSVPRIKVFYNKMVMQTQATELVKQLWKKVLTLENDSKISDLIRAPSRLLFSAAELGNVDFLVILIRTYPNLIWKVDEQNRSIFHTAVVHRQEKVFNLIHELGGLKDSIASYKDEDNNNMLHLAARLAPDDRLNTDTGAALQFRRELQWFKEVEKIVPPLYKEMRNSDGKTPQVLFTEEHKDLLREGEKWMKGTASSCMLVATLIATVMFAVFSTVPGGNNNDTGIPNFLNSRAFMVFTISDALSLVSSTTSILSFLSILTSRYAEGDFLHSLPNRLIVGQATLFISIVTMMITFVASLYIVLGHGYQEIKVPIALAAGVPVSFYALLQFPLLGDMISHAYISRVSFRPMGTLN